MAADDGLVQIQRDFVDSLERCPSMRDESSRTLIVEALGQVLGAELSLRKQATARANIIELVRVCAGLAGGLELLTDQLQFMDPLSPELPRLRHLCAEWARIAGDHLSRPVTASELNKHLAARSQPEDVPGQRTCSRDDFYSLVNALEAMPCMRDDETRSVLINQLGPTIAGTVPYHGRRRIQAINIVRACLDHEGGLAELIATLRHIEGTDSLPLRRLNEKVRDLPPEFTDGQSPSGQ